MKTCFAKLCLLRPAALVALVALGLTANARAENLTVQGRVTNPAGQPVEGPLTEFRVQILSPDANRCVLYDETHTQNLATTYGFFSINLANATGRRNLPNTYSLEDAISNIAPLKVDGTFCRGNPSGEITYVPNRDDNRKIVIRFHDPASMGNSWETIPEMDLNPVAYALEARKVGGFPASAILRVTNASGAPGVAAALTTTELAELQSLAAGTSTKYMSSISGSTTGALTARIGKSRHACAR